MSEQRAKAANQQGAPPVKEKRPARMWQARAAALLPRWVGILSLLAAAAALWAAAELSWPRSEPVGEGFTAVAPPSGPIEPFQTAAPDPASFSMSFFKRKLFIPEKPVASREMSDAVIEEMLSRLKLMSIVEKEGKLVAWVQISPRAPDRGQQRYSRSTPRPTGSQLKRVRKGDSLLDFKVEDITTEGAHLSIAGLKRTLSF